jgi:cysteine synthase
MTFPQGISQSSASGNREWTRRALSLLETDQRRSADTHLLRLDVPALADIDIYLKDESTHPTGSLKHRLARSLFLYGICNGRIRGDTPIVEASSGSTAVSEAYFAKLLSCRSTRSCRPRHQRKRSRRSNARAAAAIW